MGFHLCPVYHWVQLPNPGSDDTNLSELRTLCRRRGGVLCPTDIPVGPNPLSVRCIYVECAVMKVIHPIKNGMYPIQMVLRDLASQENCDGEPYDQMIQAADHIDDLEVRLEFFREKYNRLVGEFCV